MPISIEIGINKGESVTLAHGFEPISAADYQKGLGFLDEEVKPSFLKVAFKDKPPYAQFPAEF